MNTTRLTLLKHLARPVKRPSRRQLSQERRFRLLRPPRGPSHCVSLGPVPETASAAWKSFAPFSPTCPPPRHPLTKAPRALLQHKLQRHRQPRLNHLQLPVKRSWVQRFLYASLHHPCLDSPPVLKLQWWTQRIPLPPPLLRHQRCRPRPSLLQPCESAN